MRNFEEISSNKAEGKSAEKCKTLGLSRCCFFLVHSLLFTKLTEFVSLAMLVSGSSAKDAFILAAALPTRRERRSSALV